MGKLSTEMNATPLIDVFLVLLVMLIITLPIATHSTLLDLPVAPPALQPVAPSVDVDVDFDGRVYWNGDAVASDAELERRFRAVSRSTTLVKVWPESRVRYERVVQVLAAAQRSHVTQLSLSPVRD